MSNFLYTEFLEACTLEGLNPSSWAASNGLSNGTPTYIKRGIRPKLETLKKMITGWSDPNASARIAIAYLRDEIERLGFSLDQIKIELASIDNNYQTTLDDDLRTVQEYMNHRPIRESMHNLAALLKVREQSK